MAVKYQNYYLGVFSCFYFKGYCFYMETTEVLFVACFGLVTKGKNVVAEHWSIFKIFSNMSLLVQEEWREEEAQESLSLPPHPQRVSGSRWAEWRTAKKALGDLDPPRIAPGDEVPVKLRELHPSLDQQRDGSAAVSSGCHLQNLHCCRFDIKSEISWFSPCRSSECSSGSCGKYMPHWHQCQMRDAMYNFRR